MTQATRQFVWVMRIFAFIYFVGAILFFFMPEETFYLINVGPRVLKMCEEIPMPSERFWAALATSMMAMLLVSSLYSSLYPHVKGFVLIHVVSKAVSVTGFTYLFASHHRYFAYALGAATDTMVLLTVAGFYLRSAASERFAATASPGT